ncbi:Tn3 family transposase [Burkholderia sp. SCN-KJ]|uniref:Tn3 family transposase n=1 Tax=Burkholderia sp. SCN-KJ TaxID=2969248 RepID=UPI0035B17C97
MPPVAALEKLRAPFVTRAQREGYHLLTAPPSTGRHTTLDQLLQPFQLHAISKPASLQVQALRRRVSTGSNKGEARNSLARAVFFYRRREIRDCSCENQRYRASGPNVRLAAITHLEFGVSGTAGRDLTTATELRRQHADAPCVARVEPPQPDRQTTSGTSTTVSRRDASGRRGRTDQPSRGLSVRKNPFLDDAP